jgi:hypothetical protein
MLYREIIAVCSQIHTKHVNTLCGLNVQLAVRIVTTGVLKVKCQFKVADKCQIVQAKILCNCG